MKIMKKENKKAKKPLYKKWWFWALIVVVIGVGSKPKNVEEEQHTGKVLETEQATVDNGSFNEEKLKIAVRALMIMFVENVLEEKHKMFQYEEFDFNVDENGNGIIYMAYIPSDGTKVNITVSKEGDMYTVEYALLGGLYEVDMNTVPDKYKMIKE